MNWSRGLFRVWLSISAAWLLLVGVFSYQDYPVRYRVTTPDGVKFEITASHTLTEAEVTAAAKRQYEALPTDYFSRAAGTDKLKPPAQPINASISDYWIDHAELALLPPVVLFVVGWTVLWAGRGFKRQ